MNEKNLQSLWDKIGSWFDLKNFDEFKSKMDTPEKRKSFFEKNREWLKKTHNFELGEYNDFESRLSQASTPTPPPSVSPELKTEWSKFPCVQSKIKLLTFNSPTNSYSFKSSNSDYGYVTIYLNGTFTSTGPKYTKGTWSCTETGKIFIQFSEEPKPQETKKPQFVDINYTGDDIQNGKLVKYGMKGTIVGTIQNLLIQNGFTNVSKSGNPDNIFGSRTFKVVKDFQKDSGLNPDGVVGPKTWSELNKVTNKRPSYEVGSDDSPEFLQSKYTPEINEQTIIKKIVTKNLKSFLK